MPVSPGQTVMNLWLYMAAPALTASPPQNAQRPVALIPNSEGMDLGQRCEYGQPAGRRSGVSVRNQRARRATTASRGWIALTVYGCLGDIVVTAPTATASAMTCGAMTRIRAVDLDERRSERRPTRRLRHPRHAGAANVPAAVDTAFVDRRRGNLWLFGGAARMAAAAGYQAT